MGRHPGTYHQMKVLGFDPPILWGCFGTVRKLTRSGVMGCLGRTLSTWTINAYRTSCGFLASDERSGEVERDLWELKLATDHFLGHVHHELAVIVVCLAQQTAKLIQKSRIFSGATPKVFVSLALGKVQQLGRPVAIVEKLVHWNFQSPRHLLQCFYCRNSMIILDAGDVGAHKTRPLFDVTLRKILFFAECAKAVAYNHRGIISLRYIKGNEESCWPAIP